MLKEFKLTEKNKDLVEYFMEVIGKRDEGITNSMKQMDMGLHKAFNNIQFMFAVFEKALLKLGITKEQLQSIAEELKLMLEKEGAENAAQERVETSVEASPRSSAEMSGEVESGEDQFE